MNDTLGLVLAALAPWWPFIVELLVAAVVADALFWTVVLVLFLRRRRAKAAQDA